MDVAGEVIEVGKGVMKFKAGDKIVGLMSPFESVTASRPPEISASEFAGLPVARITTLQALSQIIRIKLDGSGERKNILITAASGGVGHYAIQLAKLGNTHVTATCGARNIKFVKSLGADEVIDYKTPEGASLKSPSGKKYDAVNGNVEDISPTPGSVMSFSLKKLIFPKKQLVPLFLLPNVCRIGIIKF